MAKKFYVVWQGRLPGIYTDWATCKQQIDKFAGARYKSFPTQQEAQAAYEGGSTAAAPRSKTTKAKKSGGIGTLGAKDIAQLTSDYLIYTDGGCEPNPGEAGSGLAVYHKNTLIELWYGLYDEMGTNNTAELKALHQAIVMAKELIGKGHSVSILCDSKYSIQCVIEWADSWKAKGWKKASGPIKNLELIKVMHALYQDIKDSVSILHVNGHVGVEGNELADRMTMLAIQSQDFNFNRYLTTLDVPTILAMQRG